jgi:hypothetical protein
LVSGLLRCAHCGSSYAIAGRDIYKCSGPTSGGPALCANDALLPREWVDANFVAGIKRDLRSPVVIAEFIDISLRCSRSLSTPAGYGKVAS